MKTLFLIISLCLSLHSVAQVKQNPSVKISMAEFVKAKKITNLIPPVNSCNITSYHFSTNIGNTVKSFDVKGDDVTPTMKTIVKEVKKGEKVIIDNIKSDCAGEYTRKYVFIIE